MTIYLWLMKNICLVGFMGSGKSAVGKLLAENTGRLFIDLDSEIEKRERRSVAEVFKVKGEPYFRQLETLSLRELLKKENLVIATGGGTFAVAENFQLIKSRAVSVYLRASEEELLSRLKPETDARPLLSGKNADELKQFIHNTLALRKPYYKQADITVDAGQLLATVTTEIKNKLATWQ